MIDRKKLEEARNWGSGWERRQAAIQASGAEAGYAWVHGQRLHYACLPGKGIPLLVCNGIGANLELGLSLAQAICRAHGSPVVLFDLPGIGGSPSGRWFPSLKHYGRLAVGLLDTLGYTSTFMLAGVSWGGTLAQSIARRYPDRVQAMVLMATSPGITMVPGRLNALLRMATPQRYLSRTYMARNAAYIYGGEMRWRPDLSAGFARLTRAPQASAYLQQLLAASTFSSLPWLARLRCSTLVMGGDDDPLIRPANLKIMVALLHDAQLHMVRGGGHLFMVMRPEETAGVISDFLNHRARVSA